MARALGSPALVVVACCLMALVVQSDILPGAAKQCPSWLLYKQCDTRWKDTMLGTGDSTICAEGCAMSSVAMALAAFNIKINGNLANPGLLNEWLNSNSGFVSGNLLVWNAVKKLGMPMEEYVTSKSTMTKEQLRGYVDNCQPVVVNVRNGGHWVLVTGYTDSSLNTWNTNDPGYYDETYKYTDMLKFVIYEEHASSQSSETAASSAAVPLPQRGFTIAYFVIAALIIAVI